jgi:hypothetical protein
MTKQQTEIENLTGKPSSGLGMIADLGFTICAGVTAIEVASFVSGHQDIGRTTFGLVIPLAAALVFNHLNGVNDRKELKGVIGNLADELAAAKAELVEMRAARTNEVTDIVSQLDAPRQALSGPRV